MSKPTPGPWAYRPFEGWKTRERGFIVNTTEDKAVMIIEKWNPGDEAVKFPANAALIVAAVNSCFKVNPDNPLAVAEALPELVEACGKLCDVTRHAGGHPLCYDMNDVRAALAKVVKP